MHVRPEWKENHQRENSRKVSAVNCCQLKPAGSSEKITVLHLPHAYFKRQPGCQQHLTCPPDCACQTLGQVCSESPPRHTAGDEESWSLGTVSCWTPHRVLREAKGPCYRTDRGTLSV